MIVDNDDQQIKLKPDDAPVIMNIVKEEKQKELTVSLNRLRLRRSLAYSDNNDDNHNHRTETYNKHDGQQYRVGREEEEEEGREGI